MAEKSSLSQARARAAERFPTYFATAPADAETSVPGVCERVEGLVVAVEEAIAMAPPESRRAEAVEILEHLLRTFRLTSADFFAAASHATPKLREALQGIALLCPNP